MKKESRISMNNLLVMTFVLILLNSCESKTDGDGNQTKIVPEITTSEVSNITLVSATCGGNINSDGGSPIIERGVCWSTSENPTVATSKTSDGTGTGIFTSTITGLTATKTYYVRAYAKNNVGIAYGNEISFIVAIPPTVTTSTFKNINGISAEAGGNIDNDGGSLITSMGICWSTTPNPTKANSFVTSFLTPLTGLSANTVYYYRAYATNVAGTGYGNQISFNSGYVIGSTYGGGLVFYNDGNAHGLVCAPSDQSIKTAKWGCQGSTIGGTSAAINSGATNTNAIVTGCTKAGIAAKICDDLVLNSYSDWYLPSIDELKLMYVNLHQQGMGNFPGFSTDYNPDYWSSTEKDKDYAWAFDFLTGYQASDYKEASAFFFNVRAVRSF